MVKKTIDPADQKKKAEDFQTESEKQSEKIVRELKKELKLFKDDRGNAYARIENNGHFENWPVSARNKNFKIWVTHRGRKILGAVPAENVVKEAITTLEGEAIFETTDVNDLFNRAGIENTPDGIKYWYDLADDNWSAVEITAQGWKVVKNPPILFKRYQHQLPQIVPDDKDNDIRLLDKYLRLNEEGDRVLIYAFLLTALITDIPHVCLILHGIQGSSKTTLFKMLRMLIDPSRLEVISMSTDKRSLRLNLDQNWFCPFDNVSGIKRDVSDIFCQAITGSGFCERLLFSDDDPFIRSIKRVIGLNGINVAAVQPDLLERCIMIELQSIDKKSRRSEEDLWKEFNQDKVKIFGGMLDVFSKAIKIKPSIVINEKLRMADFMGWGEAMARAIGYPNGYFIDAYNKNMDEINAQGIDGNDVAVAIRIMVEKIIDDDYNYAGHDFEGKVSIWDGSPSELVEKLTSIAKYNRIITDEKEKYWPGKANAMSRHINQIKPILKSEGIIVTTGERTSTGRKITIEYEVPGDIKSSKNTGNFDNPGGKPGDLNNKIIKDGDVQIDTSKNIDTNSSTLPWLKRF